MQTMPTERIQIKATPNARAQTLKSEVLEDGSRLYRVSVTATPENGKANKAVIKLLSKEFGLPKSAFTIIRGETSREKIIEISR